MSVRRFFYRWQFVAAIVLPAWLLVGWGFFGSGGWGLLGLIIVAPAAFLALGAIAAIISIRPDARSARAVSWTDVLILTVWHLAIIGIGFYGPLSGAFAILAVVMAIVAFWVSIWQLLSVGARQMRAAAADYERKQSTTTRPKNPDDGPNPIIVIHETRE